MFDFAARFLMLVDSWDHVEHEFSSIRIPGSRNMIHPFVSDLLIVSHAFTAYPLKYVYLDLPDL